jgi:hypothetical protein
VAETFWIVAAFGAGWAARSLVDSVLTKIAIRVLTSAAGGEKMAEALRKLAARKSRDNV